MAPSAPARPDQQDSRYLSAPKDIEQCFKTLRDERVDLTLTLDGSGERLNCRVLDITSRGILIEDIRPRDALAQLRKRPRFSLSARHQGTFAFVERSTISGEGEERGLPYFHVPFPKQMLFQQRRRAARYRLPLRVSSQGASITLFNKQDMTGRIIDISAGGCRAAFNLSDKNDLQIGQSFENCAINLPPVLEIHSHSIIRHVHTQRNGLTVAGIELSEMHVTDRRRLEQFIQSLSRSANEV